MVSKQICKVCGGAGGWKSQKRYRFDDNWTDCPYCLGYGFHDKNPEDEEDEQLIFAYTGYKRIILDIMSNFCNVISYQTTDKCKHIEISIVPDSTNSLIINEFIKQLMKFSHFNKRLGVEVNQTFHYSPNKEKFGYHWKVILSPSSIKDLDGFIDFIKVWDIGKKAKG